MDAFTLFYSTYIGHLLKGSLEPEVEVSPLPPVTSAAHSCFVRHIRELRKHYNLILQLEFSSASNGSLLDGKEQVFFDTKRSFMRQIDMLEKLAFDSFFSNISPVKGGSSIKVEPPNKPRDLCISNGIEIWCFHLKPEDAWPVRYAELKLVGEDVAISAGVFKLGPDVYMIGGKRVVPSVVKKDKDEDLLDRYRTLSRPYCRVDVDKSYRGFYRLSLSDDVTRLNRNKCSIFGQLNKPKFWPILEKIDGQVHVIYSFPFAFHEYAGGPNRFFSHEILDPGKDSWRVIETIENKVEDKELSRDDDYAWKHSVHYICCHLVVGNHIYALAKRKYLKFAAEAGIWEAYPRSDYDYWNDPFSVRNVWHILEGDMATRCVGEFPLGAGLGPLYIIYAVCPDWTSYNGEYNYGLIDIAYLVTLTGDVVCFQRFPQPLLPKYMRIGTIIKVEEEEEGKKALYSVIVNGSAWMDDTKEFLSINTFEAEALTENASEVGQIWAKGRKVDWPVEQDFVRVDVKDKYEYKSATIVSKGGGVKNGRFTFPHMQACFL